MFLGYANEVAADKCVIIKCLYEVLNVYCWGSKPKLQESWYIIALCSLCLPHKRSDVKIVLLASHINRFTPLIAELFACDMVEAKNTNT